MDYYIDIIDTTDNTHTTVLEVGEAGSIVLEQNGSDEKDALAIVGASLQFSMLVSDLSDAKFIDLFTGDETKYRVEIKKEADNFKIWQGFILPDSYSEPYHNGAFFVEFEATDGLGRLKGKYLPDSFYEEEKNVIEIFANILLLTGLDLPIYFSSAIDNSTVKNWHEIYINTENFLDDGEKIDAHEILETLLNDMLCIVVQRLGYWHIEGLNKRHLRVYDAFEYDSQGVFVEKKELTRSIKEITEYSLATPDITIEPPYGDIVITHEREPLAFKETLFEEENENWSILTGVIGKVYSTDWSGNNGFYAFASSPDYNINIVNGNENSLNLTKYINLREKIYIKKSQKIQLTIEVKINKPSNASSNETYIDNGAWNTYLQYDVTFAGLNLFSNSIGIVTETEKFVFDNSTNGKLSLEFIAANEGLLNIRIYQPYGSGSDSGIESIDITNVEIEDIEHEDTLTITDTISEEYTNKKELELTYADDSSGFSKAFRLARLKQTSNFYQLFDVPILSGFTQNGNNYSVVQLDGANLIADNIDTVYINGFNDQDINENLLTNLEVIYNYQDGEQMVVKSDAFRETGVFTVVVRPVNDYVESRVNWEQWTDSIYEIETERYSQVCANVFRRMFSVPHIMVDIDARFPISFTDIIKWDYIKQNNYLITNCSWNIDTGISNLRIVEASYQNDNNTGGSENLAPIVNVGDDLILENDETLVFVQDAAAFDPDGFIVSLLWEQLSGDGTATIINPLTTNTGIGNLTGDVYTFRLTATDNDGATGSDILTITRQLDYTVSLVEIFTDTGIVNAPGAGVTPQIGNWVEKHYRFSITPQLPNNFSLTINAKYDFLLDSNGLANSLTTFKLEKNGIQLESNELEDLFNGEVSQTNPLTFNYINGDNIVFKLYARAEKNPSGIASLCEAQTDLNIETINIGVGNGDILGLPLTEQVRAVEPEV